MRLNSTQPSVTVFSFLLDQLGSSITQLGNEGLGELLHPLAQLGVGGGRVGVKEASEQCPELLVSLVLPGEPLYQAILGNYYTHHLDLVNDINPSTQHFLMDL